MSAQSRVELAGNEVRVETNFRFPDRIVCGNQRTTASIPEFHDVANRYESKR
jgi:hypothetical protein